MSDASAQAGQGGFTTRMQRTVEWGDCDPAGIIFYPTYYRWMDAASWHLFEQAGYSAARMRADLWAENHSPFGIVFWMATACSNWPAAVRPASGAGTKPALAHRCGAKRCPKPCGCGWPAEYGPHARHCVCFAAPRGGRSQLGAVRRWLIRELFCLPPPWRSSSWRA